MKFNPYKPEGAADSFTRHELFVAKRSPAPDARARLQCVASPAGPRRLEFAPAPRRTGSRPSSGKGEQAGPGCPMRDCRAGRLRLAASTGARTQCLSEGPAIQKE